MCEKKGLNIVGRPCLFESVPADKNSHNAARAGVRKHSRVSPNVVVSLQSCDLKDNSSVLESKIDKAENEKHRQRLQGLKAILDVLLSQIDNSGNVMPDYTQSFMSFSDAFEQFLGFQPGTSIETAISDERKNFKELLCHPDNGLCVYIVFNPFTGNSFIALRPDEVSLGNFFDTLIQDTHEIFDRVTLNHEIVHTVDWVNGFWMGQQRSKSVSGNKSNKGRITPAGNWYKQHK